MEKTKAMHHRYITENKHLKETLQQIHGKNRHTLRCTRDFQFNVSFVRLRATFTSEKKKMCDDMNALEEAMANVQMMMERAIREKRYASISHLFIIILKEH